MVAVFAPCAAAGDAVELLIAERDAQLVRQCNHILWGFAFLRHLLLLVGETLVNAF